MEIKRNSTLVADVWAQNTSYVNEELMGDHTLSLDFLTLSPVELEVGDSVEFEGTTYTIRHKEKITKQQTSRGFEYNAVFYASQYRLQDVPFFLSGEPEYLKNGDYYTGTATEWLALIVKNMNREDSGWSAGSSIESEWITLSFKDKQCSEVLDELCSQLDTEYSISGKTISIGRVEYSSNGLKLGQGQGMGFTELSLESSDQERPVTVIYPYGGDSNLPEGYGADYLLLPDGETSIEKNVEKYGRCAMKVQFEGVYPRGTFEVTSIIDEFTFTATGIDFDMAECLIPDQEVTVSFQSGALAGYDLAIAEEGGWDYATKTIKVLQNEEENALKVPGDIHIATGDRFILYNLRMPQSYVDKAEQELKEKAEAWLSKKCEKLVRLRGKCDDILFRQNKIHVACGQMVMIVDERLNIEREIRCTKVKRYIENEERPYRYEITLSDYLDTNGFKDFLREVENTNEEIKKELKPVKGWTKRAWKDVMETLDMMFDPEGDYFTELVKPLAVHTAELVVGTNSQQMDFVGVTFQPNKNGDPNLFGWTSGKLVHFTVDETGIREWSITGGEASLDGSMPYYVYAKCPRSGDTGTILCSTSQIKLLDDPDCYHFWVGVLNTPQDGVRSWQPNYGFTEIAGQYITTGVIKDKAGNFVIDLNEGAITGWGAMTDKPNMDEYAKISWANGEINALAERVDELGNTIATAGWITSADGNELWASKTLENGSTIISKINQTATTVTIDASHINLKGAVTFNSFSSDLQDSFNDKVGSSSLSSILSSYVTSSALSNTLSDYALASSLSSYVKSSTLSSTLASYAKTTDVSSTAQAEAQSAVNTLKNALVNGSTTIVGGFISTSLIDVDNLYCTSLSAVRGTVGGFSVSDTTLKNGSLSLTGGVITLGETTDDYYTRIGGVSAAAGSGPMMYVKNANNSFTAYETNGACIFLKCGYPYYQNTYQKWIEAEDGQGTTHFELGVTHLTDPTDGISRIYIKAYQMAYKTQLVNVGLVDSPDWKTLVYDTKTGLICWDF